MKTHNWIGGPKMKDLKGLKFGRLTVISYNKRIKTNMDKNHKTFATWLCKCDCGRIIIKTGRALLHDKTKSCGCLQKETMSINGRKKIKPSTFLLRYYKIYKYTANKRHISFNLNLKEFNSLVTQNCYLCGQGPEPKILCRAKYYNNKILFNGIDRLNSLKGYNINNCKPCCTMCNLLKRDLTYNTFISQIKKIINFVNQ
jgi:hypothetical protein